MRAPAPPEPTSRLLAASPFRVLVTQYPAYWAMPAHAHTFSNVSVVVRGQVLEETPNGRAVGTASSVTVKPAKVVHENRFGPEGAVLLNVQLGDDADLNPLPADGLHRWAWLHTGTATEEAVTLPRAAEAPEADALADAVYSLLGALPEENSASGAPPPWLLRVRDRLQDTPTFPHRVEQLAEEAGVHPVYLARVFKQHFHVTITAYLRHLRLRLATDLLASSKRPLSDIAYGTGFADQSHFGRVFKTTLQTSPGAFRTLVRRFEQRKV